MLAAFSRPTVTGYGLLFIATIDPAGTHKDTSSDGDPSVVPPLKGLPAAAHGYPHPLEPKDSGPSDSGEEDVHVPPRVNAADRV